MSPGAKIMDGGPLTICDLTQSWSEVGGGVRTYLLHKRSHILERSPHRHILIIPGAEDGLDEEAGGRAVTVRLRSPKVPGSPNYRLLLRNGAVRSALQRFSPDLIECQDSYNLPWAAIGHRKRHPRAALVGGYFTDFPTVYAERPLRKTFGQALGAVAGRLCYRYCGALYGRFDAVFALSENGGAARLREFGVDPVDIVPLGVELGEFRPERRDPRLRRALGLGDDQPLLAYAGRLDVEKASSVVVEAFRMLPESLGAKLLLLGEGPLKEQFEALGDPRIIMPGYLRDRAELARHLASADIYVTAFAQETFGVSIVEAQASGLPVVGVSEGALLDRVGSATGRLGPVNDPAAMARNILEVWNGDRAAIGQAARAQALNYSWDRCMAALFDDVYPRALSAASARPLPAPRGKQAPLARA
jgi:alpha-1,6-mannosyltransferase